MRFFRSHKVSALTDEQIVARYRTTHDKNLVGVLFDRHAHLVFGICFNMLRDEDRCKDAVLTIFENLIVQLLKYEVRHFSAWVHSVSRNYCLAELKRLKKEACREMDIECLRDEDAHDDTRFEKHIRRLNGALASIGRDQKRCIELFYLEKKSYREVAEQTGFTFSQVKSHIQNGKRNLKKILTHAP